MSKLGIICERLPARNSSTGKRLFELAEKMQCLIFVREPSSDTSNLMLPIFDLADAYRFDGVALTLTLEDTIFAAYRLPLVNTVVYCPSKVEWKDNKWPWQELCKVFHSEEIKVMPINTNTYQMIKNIWRQPDGYIEGFSHERIEQVLLEINGRGETKFSDGALSESETHAAANC